MLHSARASAELKRRDRLTQAFVGVLDLRRGAAVHARGGIRENYQVVSEFRQTDGNTLSLDGSPIQLAECYLSESIRQFYLADLDGIENGTPQRQATLEFLDRFDEHSVIWDPGVRGRAWLEKHDWVLKQIGRRPRTQLAIATECGDPDVLSAVLDRVPTRQVVVSFDYRGGNLVSRDSTEQEWIDACESQGVSWAIALDLASIGSEKILAATQICQGLKRRIAANVITGGGIASFEDAESLLSAGACRLLVASLFVR